MELHVFDAPEKMSEALAGWITDLIRSTLQKQERFTIALSGGNTPKQLHHLLASAPFKQQIAWDRLHFFWGDERDVPFEDDRSNARMAFDTLLYHVPIIPDQVHVMKTDIDPEKSAAEYEQILKRYFPPDPVLPRKSFDLVLLGMGDDGHTLSLFPGTPVVHEEKKWVTSFFLPAQKMNRITLTKSIVNVAGHVAFLAVGSGKSKALKEVLEGDHNPDLYPSQEIKLASGEVHWFVDKAATALL